jgi:hypothetical protein
MEARTTVDLISGVANHLFYVELLAGAAALAALVNTPLIVWAIVLLRRRLDMKRQGKGK